MPTRILAREKLWEVATEQHGYVTAKQALGQGINRAALNKLVHRGTLERASFGVYRFPKFPYTDASRFMLAVLWTRATEAALSHETALFAYEISDILPDRIHVTISSRRRLRRINDDRYEIHFEDLEPELIDWWHEIPTVTPATAIRQCIGYGTPTHLLRQAIERGRRVGRITAAEQKHLSSQLKVHRG